MKESNRTEPANSPLLGLLYMCAATAFFAMLDSLNKYLGQILPIAEVVWVRYAVHLALMIVILAPRMGWRLVQTRRPWLHVARALSLLASSVCAVYSLRHIPVADATAIYNAAPLLIVLLSGPMLGEKVGLRRVVVACVGFIGVLIIIRPGTDAFQPASLAMVLAALSGTAYQLLSRELGVVDHPMTSLFFLGLVGTVATGLVVPFSWVPPPSIWVWLLMGLCGIVGGAGQYLITQAYSVAPASIVAPFSYSQLIWATLASWLIFGDVPSWWTLLGMVIVAGSGLYITRIQRKTA